MTQITLHKGHSKTRRVRAAREILNLILIGHFKGGDRLVEEELASNIGVSRTPIREALGELAGIGLIALKPNQGAVVRPFGPTQIRELYHVRRVLEAEATRMAADRIDPAALGMIREKTQESLHDSPQHGTRFDRAMELDQQFHELISTSSGSQRLAEEIGRYRTLVQAIREAVGHTEHALDAAREEHTQIIDLLLARQGNRAAEAMYQHIERGAETAVAALFDATRQSTLMNKAGNGRGTAIRPVMTQVNPSLK